MEYFVLNYIHLGYIIKFTWYMYDCRFHDTETIYKCTMYQMINNDAICRWKIKPK